MSTIPGRIESLAEEGANVVTQTRAHLGLRKLAPGAGRLLGELVRRGLAEDDLPAAARICLELEERATR